MTDETAIEAYAAASGDEVDDLVAAWRRERPDLDVAPLEVLSRVTRLARHLDRARGQAFRRHGLEGWEFDVLGGAPPRRRRPTDCPPGQLLQQTLVTSGTMTNRIDRLAARGFVERHPSLDDRRSVMVQLTDAGAAKVDAALIDLLAHERAILADLATLDAEQLAGLLRGIVAPFDQSRPVDAGPRSVRGDVASVASAPARRRRRRPPRQAGRPRRSPRSTSSVPGRDVRQRDTRPEGDGRGAHLGGQAGPRRRDRAGRPRSLRPRSGPRSRLAAHRPATAHRPARDRSW